MKNVEDIYRLSPMQAGMLFHCLAAPGDPVYFEQYLAQIAGELAVPVFERAWTSVIARHHVLRTAFVWEGLKEPLQVVRRQVSLPLEVLDWSDRPAESHADAFEELLRADRARPFVLTQAPLMRLTLVRLAPDRHALLWSFHHLLLDGWSCAVAQREVAECYAAELAGVSLQTETPRPYAEYIQWLRDQDLAGAEQFWREYLSGAQPTPLRFEPAADPDGEPDDSAELTRELTAEATARVIRAARAQGLALNTVCQAAWALVLARYAGVDDVLFGAIVSGRPAALQGVERMVGLFINTLCVRVRAPRHERVGAWLARVQVEAAAAREHEYTPLADAQRWSGIRHESIFESVCVYESYPRAFGPDDAPIDVPLRVSPLRTVEKTNYPLTLVIIPGDRLQLMLVVQKRRFAVDAMAHVLSHYAVAIEALLEDPARELQSVSLLTPDERARVVGEWNDTTVDPLAFTAVHASFERQAARTPEAIAVVFGDETATYESLSRRANRLARHLRAQGGGPETIVGVCLDRSIELVVAILAVLKAGAAYAPLDPQYPEARLASALDDAAISLVLTHTSLAGRLPIAARRLCLFDRWDDESPATDDDTNGSVEVAPESLAYVLFTSGSTGRPKGVMIPHRALANHMRWMQRVYPLSASDRVLQKTSFGFDASVWEFYAPLVAGATLVVAEPGIQQDPALLVEAIDRYAITILQVVPSMLRLLVDTAGFGGCRSLRRVFVGGEPLSVELQTRFFEVSPAELVNLYGPTEVTIDSVAWSCRRDKLRARVPIGVPVDNTTAYVLDDRLEPEPVGVAGELWLGGLQVGRGYCGRPDLTAERFVPDPFSDTPGARVYRTGDLARYGGDGVCEFLGRADHQVKLHGYRIELGEIEAALRAQPGVRAAVVHLREDVPGQSQLVAYVVPESAESIATDVLQQELRDVLPDYMVPTTIVSLEALPLTPNGKVDRAALPAPDALRRRSDTYVPPRDALELQLVRLWEELLQTRPIGVRDEFFEIGGHSILVLHLVAHIERTFEIRVSLADLVQGTTIERLASIIRQKRAGAEPRLVLLQPGGTGTPLFAMVPAGGTLACYIPLAEAMSGDRPFYALQPRSSMEEAATARTIELMAQADLEELRRVQPAGPYALIGWSMGGLIAYEMACLLREAGEKVELMALLDAGVPDADERPRDALQVVIELGAQHLDINLADLGDVQGEARFEALLELAQRSGKLAHEVDMRWVRWLADGFRASTEATQLYRPRPYDGSVVLIRAAEHESRGEDTMGWGALARGGVDVHWVPGAHHNIVHQPHVAAVGDTLRACLAVAGEAPAMAGPVVDVT